MLLLVSCGSRSTSTEFASSLAFKMHLRLNGISQWRYSVGQILSGELSCGICIWRRAPSLRGLTCARPLLLSGQQQQVTVAGQSRFAGVHWHSRVGKWTASILHPASKMKKHLGVFEDELVAAAVCDAAEVLLRGSGSQRNFPDRAPSQQQLDEVAQRLKPQPRSSAFRGVYQSRGLWHAKIVINGTARWLGTFETELEAAESVDSALRCSSEPRFRLLAHLNFLTPADFFSEETWHSEPVPEGKTSRFLGVHYDSQRQQYRAKARSRHVGLFHSEFAAARAFDVASATVGGRTNFLPPGHPASWPCSLGRVLLLDVLARVHPLSKSFS